MTTSWRTLFDRAESHDVDREVIRTALEWRRGVVSDDVSGDDGSATGDPGDDGSATNGQSDDGPSDDSSAADVRDDGGPAPTEDEDG